MLDSATDEYVRARAHRALEEVPSASDISALLNEISAAQRDRPVRKIKPLLDCVSPLPGGGWIAWFGYENPFDYDYWLGFSTGKNKFEPQPHERGQPETFKKGGHPRAFSITFDGDPVTRFVKEEKVTVSRTFSTRCSE